MTADAPITHFMAHLDDGRTHLVLRAEDVTVEAHLSYAAGWLQAETGMLINLAHVLYFEPYTVSGPTS